MEVFQNGRFSTGEPVYQIGTKNSDGTYEVKVFDLMSKEQATARLKEMGIAPTPDNKYDVKDVNSMSKLELESMMRKRGVELDRRKKKTTLAAKAKAHLAKD